jgi:DNA-binding LytR/AlgR family response regulator
LALKISPVEQEKHIYVKDGCSTIKISLNDILYIESDKNYIHIFTKKEKITCRYSLEWIMQRLPPCQFIQTHRSFIINSYHIKKLTYKTVYLEEGEVPISKSNYARMLEFIKTKSE